MKMTIDAYEMKRILAERDRDYYSEYGAALELDDLICDYSYLMDEGEEETVENLVKHLEEKTTVLELQNGNYLVYAF